MKKLVHMFKMHISLLKFLLVEIPKKKTANEIIIFLKKIGKEYSKVMLQEYKNSFLFLDPDYQKQKKAYEKNQEIKKSLQIALNMLKYIDKKMVQAGKSRQERKIFWRDFFKNAQCREDVFKELDLEIKR